MAFSADRNQTGVPDFRLIHIDPEETAKCLQVYLDTASKLTGVSLDDINTSVITLPPDVEKVTLAGALQSGMKLFDAIVWLTAGRPKTHPLVVDPALVGTTAPSMHEIARSVFYCYFMLITQARYPVGKLEKDKPRIPNFLKTIMGMDQEQHIYVDMICSFPPQKFDPAWVKFVTFKGFGQEVLSRFGLGVAGYRMFNPFGLYSPRADMSKSIGPAFEFAKRIATSKPSWDVHPLTRNPNVLARRGNLNKNLGNLMLEVFSESDLNSMRDTKVIYAIPSYDPNHIQYKQWVAQDDISGQNFIFPEP